MELLARVFLPTGQGAGRQFLTVKIDEDESNPVRALKAQIAEKVKLGADSVQIFFCGTVIDEATDLRRLLLSPQTYLTVVVSDQPRALEKSSPSRGLDDSTSNTAAETRDGSFYVYCKKCETLGTAKLRLYCSRCKGLSTILTSEPHSWDDILSGKLQCECKDCDAVTTSRIDFKCVTCCEVSTPLRHLRKNRANQDCVICGTVDPTVVCMNCTHAACVPCFAAYVEQALLQWNFSYKPMVGYTVTCPFFGCPGYIYDTHHFYVLGKDTYKEFQRKAAEKFVSLNGERQYCPYPKCGAVFLLEDDVSDSNESTILCPECARLYCRKCHHPECRCDHQDEVRSRETLRSISKPCPTCQAPTERSGGCAHIKCTACHYEWCFVCHKPWSDGCQWDHWLI